MFYLLTQMYANVIGSYMIITFFLSVLLKNSVFALVIFKESLSLRRLKNSLKYQINTWYNENCELNVPRKLLNLLWNLHVGYIKKTRFVF